MHIPTLLLSILLFYPIVISAKTTKAPRNAILLSNVKTLTLRDKALTSHRRVPAMPQLTCKGPGCAYHKVDIMRCTNAGSDYSSEDVQWSCVANVPEDFKLGSTDVICEGYASSDDEYVLKGSCGVEYRLLLTDKGEEKYGKPSMWKDSEGGVGIGGVLFMACFFGVLGWILYSMYTAYMNNNNPNAPRRPRAAGWGGNGGWGGGGGGGGGDNGWDDPPPPYSKPSGSQPGQQGYRPGFWTGALGGAAAGYAAGNMGNRQNGRTSMFGGGNNTGGSSWGTPSRPSPRSSSSSSSARHESTGFGSTTRR